MVVVTKELYTENRNTAATKKQEAYYKAKKYFTVSDRSNSFRKNIIRWKDDKTEINLKHVSYQIYAWGTIY